jgi:alcohol dehydrogenase class IV
VLDPELTLSMPRDVTIATGLDALSQAMEGFVSNKATEVGDLLALEACRIIRSYLPIAANDPQNLEARGQMLYAANLSGTIIAQSGTTLVHGMGYYYTLHHDVAHGLANALLLSPVFEWNARHLPQKVAALAGALGVICPAEPVSAAVGIREALVGFLETLGVSPAARDAGVSSAALADHATDIAGDPYRFKNQVGSLDPSHIEQLFRASWAGQSAGFD